MLTAADVDKKFIDAGDVGLPYIRRWVVIIFAGWGPLQENYRINQYLTRDLVKDYDRVLAVLCDSTNSIESRRKKLSSLYGVVVNISSEP